MKNILFCFAVLGILFSCQENQSYSSQHSTATLSGSVTNATGPEISVFVDGEETRLEIQEEKFEYTFEIEEPKMVTIRHGNIYDELFVSPGKTSNVQITIQDKDAEGSKNEIQYSGDFAFENNFQSTGLDAHQLPGYKERFAPKEEEFINSMDTYKATILNAISVAQAEKSFDPAFASILNAEVEYDLANQFGNYERYHRYVTENEDFNISPLMQSIVNNINLDNPEAIESPKYQAYVESFIQESAWNSIKDDENLKRETGAMTNAAMFILDKKIKSPKVKDLVLYQIMKSALYDGLQIDEQDAYDRFKNENQNEAYLAQISSLLNKWERLSVGKEAPSFAYQDVEGNEISLNDLKGKVVYVDVWATWCGPCKAEHPDLEKLEGQYASNPSVAFVGVSIDEDKAAWEKMVTEKEMKGYQIFADNAWDSNIVKEYMIKGIPRFILIDANGNIIDASAPRPSSGKVADLIDTELAKSTREALLIH